MYTSGNLSLRSELVEVSILPTQLVDFLYDKLGEFRLNGMNVDIIECKFKSESSI